MNVIVIESYSMQPFDIGFSRCNAVEIHPMFFARISSLLFFTAEEYSTIWIYHNLFVHSSSHCPLTCVLEGPQSTYKSRASLGWTRKTQCIVILTAVIYYNRKTEATNISEGRRHMV